MDKGKNPGKSNALLKSKTNMIYMDLREIIREHALRYLPAKSLYRFNAVCRGWKLQIPTPFFAHSQSFAFRSLSGLFCQTPDGSISFISLDQMAYGVPDPQLKFLPEPVDVLASSHGLLCCRGRSGEMPYYICNPVSQIWKKLPKPEADHGLDPALVLVFEPSLLNFIADYKLICAFRSSDFEGAYEFEIYSSIEESWKISPEICFGENGRVLKAGGVYVNGVVYWLSNNYSVIGFDVKKNRVKVIPNYDVYGYPALGIVDGKICLSRKRGRRRVVMMTALKAGSGDVDEDEDYDDDDEGIMLFWVLVEGFGCSLINVNVLMVTGDYGCGLLLSMVMFSASPLSWKAFEENPVSLYKRCSDQA